MSKKTIRVCLSKILKPSGHASCRYNVHALEKIFSPYEIVIDDKAPDLLLYTFWDRDLHPMPAAYRHSVKVFYSEENVYRYAMPSTESWIVKKLLSFAERRGGRLEVLFSTKLFTVLCQWLRSLSLDLAKWLILRYVPEKGWYRRFILLGAKSGPRLYGFIRTHVLRSCYSILSNTPSLAMPSLPMPMGIFHKKWIEDDYQAIQQVPLEQKKFCCIVVSNLYSIPRLHFYMKLSHYKRVDFYSKTGLANTVRHFPGKEEDIVRSGLYREYKFVICFENSLAERWFTEKLVVAMYADSIPIYWGDPCAGEYFNSERMIAYSDYKSFDKMMDKVIELDQDHEKYRAFVAQPKQRPANIRKVEAMWSSYYGFMAKVLETVTTQKEKEQEAEL